MRVAIIDYGSGNLRSVAKALERVADDPSSIRVTRSPDEVAVASHIVLPGVGAFADCMAGLKALPGMREAMSKQVLERGTPFLGICVGMQMLFERGHEHGTHEGLGWLRGEVMSLENRTDAPLKIPHMGWNELRMTRPHPLLNGIRGGDHAYFVHSYHAQCGDAYDVLATTDYGQIVTAVVGRGNIMGTQFHPEKSQETGLQLLKNFLSMSS
ncbi:MAG: imidazole glycerol phosphate synthase subunit HisH [Pseudomonadota bacterium]|nr:imidazole glycerol phosphate synthase subunit HisH [Pseudomonadota bacterium]